MRGYIAFSSLKQVRFGFNVPVPETGGRVDFEVIPVNGWGSRTVPRINTLIGLLGGTWRAAEPGEEYERTGLYLGNGLLLTVGTSSEEG